MSVTATTRAASALAVTGAKGGVGKSNLVTNLAVALARWGRRVLLVDGDLGLSNLDVLMGLMPSYNIDHVIRGEVELADVLIDGPSGVQVLPAASGLPGMCRLDDVCRARLLEALSAGSHGMDDLLVDTGAGLGETTLTLQLAASRVLLVTTPEPTSLVDAYATLKVLWAADPDKSIDVVVNNVADEPDADRAFQQIARASRHFLGREPGWFGPVYRDPCLQDAVRRQRPLLELHPNSPAGRCYERIALRLTLGSETATGGGDYWSRLLDNTEGLAH